MEDDVIWAPQQKINGYLSILLKGFGVGSKWTHSDRVRESTINLSKDISPMDLVIKDHKVGKEGCLQKTRPIGSGCKSICMQLAGILSDLIIGLAN